MYAPSRLHLVLELCIIFIFLFALFAFTVSKMVQVPFFPIYQSYNGRLWSSYRGRRAGKQVKERETYRYYSIEIINPRSANQKPRFLRFIPRHNPSNCTYIKPHAHRKTKSSEFTFVPSFLLANMSLSPKIDELRHVLHNCMHQ